MKKVLSIIFLITITLVMLALFTYLLYIKPISEIKGLDKWYEYIAEPTFADAIMDRLVNNAIHIELKGDSMRRKKKNKNNFTQ